MDPNLMPARVVIGYGDRKFSVFPDELTTFLINCDALGYHTIPDLSQVLQDMAEKLNNGEKKEDTATQAELLSELSLMLRGLVYEGV